MDSLSLFYYEQNFCQDFVFEKMQRAEGKSNLGHEVGEYRADGLRSGVKALVGLKGFVHRKVSFGLMVVIG